MNLCFIDTYIAHCGYASVCFCVVTFFATSSTDAGPHHCYRASTENTSVENTSRVAPKHNIAHFIS